jgi:hypothetical protein
MQQCEELWKYELYVHKLLNTLETAKSFRVKATAIEGETKKKKKQKTRFKILCHRILHSIHDEGRKTMLNIL